MLGNYSIRMGDETGSVSWSVAAFDISSAKPSDNATFCYLVNLFVSKSDCFYAIQMTAFKAKLISLRNTNLYRI
jgi:hypothetical protein